MSSATQRVQAALAAHGVRAQIVEFPQGTRTAQDAAAAIGTTVAQIVKSLVFIAGEEPLLVETSGSNRVDLSKLEARLGVPVRQANADEVRQLTGFAIGGVPPVGHKRPIRTLIDEDLMAHEEIFAAAGTPHTVFRLTPQELVRLTGGTLMDVKQA